MNSMFKRSLVALTAVSMLTVTGGAAQAASVGVALNNKQVQFQANPYLKNGQTMVQLRTIVEAMGGTVTWDQDKQQVIVKIGNDTSFVRIDGPMLVVNDRTYELSVRAELKNGVTMVPVRIFEKLGAEVKWDAQNKQVLINWKGEQAVLDIGLNYEIESLDPAQTYSWEALSVIAQTNEGLIHLDKDGYAVAGMANKWQVSPDGKTYTFHLRDNAYWSDGSLVQAGDFEFAWKRALDSTTRSQWAFLFSDLVGADEFNSDKQTADDVGVKALDPRTLEIKLERPVPYFLEQLAHPIFYPAKQSFVASMGGQYGQDPDKVLSNGPFTMTEWVHNGSMKLVKNESYWEAYAVGLKQVNYTIVDDMQTRLDLYAKGKLDRIALDGEEYVNQYKGTADYSTVADGIVNYLSFNIGRGGLNNASVRKALTYALDLNALSDLQGDHAAATGFVPSGMSNHRGGDFRQDGGDLIKQAENAAKAKALLAEGLKELGLTELPTLTLLVDDTVSKKKLAEQLTADWKKNLGVEIKVEAVPFKFRLQRSHEHNFDIVLSAWGPDYSDAATFLDLMETGQAFNFGQYSDPNYDELLKKADDTPDVDVRTKALHEAEEMLMSDMPVAPLYFNQKAYLTKPYVKGLETLTYPYLYDLKFAVVEGK